MIRYGKKYTYSFWNEVFLTIMKSPLAMVSFMIETKTRKKKHNTTIK